MVILDEYTPFLRDINTDVWFVCLPMADSYCGNAVVNCDVQSAIAVETLHAPSSSLFHLAYDGLLVPVVCASSGLTTLIGEPCG